jgi:poly(A) polymerase
MTEREFAIEVVKRLRDAGYQALWAGGCVRDELLGLVPQDYDVATDARPEEVRRLFRRSTPVGASFGVVEVIGPRTERGTLTVEVATFRSDVSYSDGRQDLQAGLLRAIGNPLLRFQEDKLRMLRAVRIATRFGLTVHAETATAIRAMAHQLPVVSAERIADELRKLLVHLDRARGMNLLLELGLAQEIFPEVVAMRGLPQGPPAAPTGDLWDHVMRVLEHLGPEPSFPLAFGALLHDVGKPRTVGRTPDRYTFYYHEHVGARMAAEIAVRLKLSNAERDRVEWLVEKHQVLCDARNMRTSKLKQLFVHPGIQELLALHRADALAAGRSVDHVEYCEYLLREWTTEDLNPSPLLTGHDLARHGLEPGPLFKELLDAVREAQLEGTVMSRREALELVDRLLVQKKPESS